MPDRAGEGKIRNIRAVSACAAVLALVATSCGSLLSDDERAELISALSRRRRAAAVTAGGTGGGTGSIGGVAPGTSASGAGGSTSGGGRQGEGAGGSGVASCAKATKATDVGVTPSKITVATLADISGIQPGLFESSHQAARAAVTYINSQGGICGRQIDLLPLDTKTDAGGNRAAMIDACQKAFAVVGSMSAFDEGSAAPGRECGIPDITAITTNRLKYDAPNTFPIFPSSGPYLGTTPAEDMAKRFPDAVKKAAVLYLNQAVTRTNALARKVAWESVGYKFIYEAEVQVLEANYTRFVQEMRDRGVQYVTMVSDYQSLVRLQKSMRQQGYTPKVRAWDSVAYDPGYLSEREAVEGSTVFLNTALLEEASSNPEVKLYTDWLQRAAPGAVPDYFGIHTWSAFRLFQKLTTQIGPELTRAKLLSALKATAEWGGNGLHAPHRTGAKQPSTCNITLEVSSARFQRMAPASGFDCSGKLYREKG